MRGKNISDSVIAEVKRKRSEGLSYRKIAIQLSLSNGAVQKICKRLKINGQICHSGRPSSITDRTQRHLSWLITSGKCDTSTEISRECSELNLHPQTIRRALKKSGFRAVTKTKKPLLNKQQMAKRYAFAKEHENWTEADWHQVIFSDESKINRINSDGRLWCYRKRGSPLEQRVVSETVKFGGGSLMVWGCITAKGPGYLTRIDGGLDAQLYCNILEDELLWTIEEYEFSLQEVIFQQDNDPKHRAKKTLAWLEERKIKLLKWPSQSPDLNPIETVWCILKNRLRNYPDPPRGINELWSRVEACWEEITPKQCLDLTNSMPRRISAVIKAKGGSTKW